MAYEPGKLIGVVEKNRVQDMRVSLVKLREGTFVDLRVFAGVGDDERRPTKKGMTFRPELLPELIKVLIEATREGLLKPQREAVLAARREANAAGPIAEQAQGAAVSIEAPVAAGTGEASPRCRENAGA